MTRTPSRTFGTVVHQVLADLIEVRGANWGAEQRLCWLALHPLVQAKVAGPAVATRNRLAVSLGVYQRHFVLSDRWHLVGVNVGTQHSELDFVWCRDDGVIIADEVKSGEITSTMLYRLEEQLARQLGDGPSLYGEPFAGVRALLLQAPGDSRFFRVDGSIEPLNAIDVARETV